MSLDVIDIHKSFRSTDVLKGVSLTLEKGEFVALLGPSGSGKTTLLNIIAGLAHADSGRLVLDGEDFTALPARQRRFGMVFQSYALFRHMNVRNNIAFGLTILPRQQRPSRSDIAARTDELLDMIGLQDLAERYPAQLSGGQRQRVAMARALAIEPRLLLMDEPFSALDAHIRAGLRSQVREIQRKAGVGAIMVTHDQIEATALADRIAVMENGRIVQFSSPDDLRSGPAAIMVADPMPGAA
ncbi:MAG: ABC transporter ATP-binding protein [Pseudomonadota bacterium]